LTVSSILNKTLKPLTAYNDTIRAIVFKIIGLDRTKFEFETPAL
jgi:hypothetical protein